MTRIDIFLPENKIAHCGLVKILVDRKYCCFKNQDYFNCCFCFVFQGIVYEEFLLPRSVVNAEHYKKHVLDRLCKRITRFRSAL